MLRSSLRQHQFLCWLLDWIYMYVYNWQFPFQKTPTPRSDPTKKNIFMVQTIEMKWNFLYKNQTTQEKKTKKKPMVLSWKLMVFLGFWNTHNQWFFVYVVFQIPGTGKFFDSSFLKYPILTILWFWFFFNSQNWWFFEKLKNCTTLVWTNVGQFWLLTKTLGFGFIKKSKNLEPLVLGFLCIFVLLMLGSTIT